MTWFLNLTIPALVFLALPNPSFAQEEIIQNNPKAFELNATSLERKRKGYGRYPVVQCPGVKTKYLEFLSKLDKIKENIKKEACPVEAQKNINAEVDNVKNLVAGDQRKEFVDIMKKGLTDGAEVSAEDANKVRAYVEAVVKTTAVISGFTKNSACFDDNDQNITLATLSSIISEASSALGAVAGPLGAKITLGGKIAAGLVDSVGAIIKARETYCKGTGALGWGTCSYEPAAEQAYVSTLCSYYQFKFDIDEITNPENRLLEIGQLRRETDQQLTIFSAECEECDEIIRDFTSALNATVDPDEDPVTFDFIDGASSGPRTISKPLNELSYADLLNIYSKQIEDSKGRYDVKKGRQVPAYYTVRTLRTQSWAEFELSRVSRETSEDDADVALSQVRVEQNQIEQFLFEDEAPKFIKFAASRAQDSVLPFIQLVFEGYWKISEIEYGAQLLPDPSHKYSDYYTKYKNLNLSVNLTADRIHDIFRHDIEFIEALTSSLEDKELKRRNQKVISYLESLRFTVLAELKAVKRNYAIFRDYCRLFEFGKLRYNGPVGDTCIHGHENQLVQLKSLFAALEDTLLGVYAQEFQAGRFGDETVLSDVNTPDRHYTRDWVTSLTQFIKEQNGNAAEDIITRLESPLVFDEGDVKDTPVESDSEVKPETVESPTTKDNETSTEAVNEDKAVETPDTPKSLASDTDENADPKDENLDTEPY